MVCQMVKRLTDKFSKQFEKYVSLACKWLKRLYLLSDVGIFAFLMNLFGFDYTLMLYLYVCIWCFTKWEQNVCHCGKYAVKMFFLFVSMRNQCKASVSNWPLHAPPTNTFCSRQVLPLVNISGQITFKCSVSSSPLVPLLLFFTCCFLVLASN